MNTRALAACFALGLASSSGCVPLLVGAGAGVAGYHYVEGEMQYAVQATVDRTYKAVEAVVKDRGWEIKDVTREVTIATFRCQALDKTPIQIEIKRRSPDFTRVAIRYGTWGDEVQSRKFIDDVRARL